jgi:hypothetical protein
MCEVTASLHHAVLLQWIESEFHYGQVNYNILNMTEAITFSTIHFHAMEDFKIDELYFFKSTIIMKHVIRETYLLNTDWESTPQILLLLG